MTLIVSNDINSDWLKDWPVEEVETADELLKHLPGRHDQQRHAGSRGAGGVGPVGLRPDLERQARFRAILDDPKLSQYRKDKAIRDELESLEGGPEALRQLEKWYWNPGEDMLPEIAEKMGWDPEGDTALLSTLQSIKDGTASSAQVDAMSAIYDYTQAHLQHSGVDEVYVHRGLALDPWEADSLRPGTKIGTALSGHWSANEDVSEQFAAQIYEDVEGWDFQEVVIHRKFKSVEIFNHHMANADKFDEYVGGGLSSEEEIVPVNGTEHTIAKTEKSRSRYTGEEVLHVWVW